MDIFKINLSLALFLTLLVGGGHNTIASAGSVQAINNSKFYFGVSGGVVWPSIPDDLNINNGANVPFPQNTDRYSMKQKSTGSLALQAGYEWQRNTQWFPSYAFGIQFAHYWLDTIKGTITQYSLPQFTNYSYTWGMKSDVFSLNTKVNIIQYGHFRPFVQAGIGLAMNRSNDVYETAFSGVTPRISPEFSNHTQINFAYNLGAGIDYLLSENCSLLLAYNYQNSGSMRSSNGFDTWSGEYLDIKNYRINMLVLGAVYRFDSKFI